MRIAWIALGSVGCGDNARLEPVPELVRALDVDPDPDVVEINLVAADGEVEYLAGRQTPVMGYRDGSIDGAAVIVPGPLIEAKLGDRLIVHVRNELSIPTTVHWHGLRLPIEMDGDPTVNGSVAPGASFDYDFVLRDTGFFWYHPHVDTDMQIEMGLQGPLVIRAPDEPIVETERYFVLDDVDLAGDGSVRIEPSHEDLVFGRRGDTLLVNGKPPGAITTRGGVERWRIVNTSNGRFFDLHLDGIAMRVIGWDGGLIPEPYEVERLPIAPGERYDVLVALGDRPRMLRTLGVARGHDGFDRGPLDLVYVELAEDAAPPGALPATTATIPRLPVSAGSAVRRFTLREEVDGPAGTIFFINDQRWPLNTPIPVTLGDVEIWEIVNDEDGDHPMHVHGHFFQVLDRDGVPEPRLGWKDTIAIGARSTVRAALQYEEPGKWMFHCQIPEHAERGMTADVEVTPGSSSTR
ncbi:MAG: multicopper oxidase family protein [Deltaproteobacteria bacterium]|nr:multicopper oxidase family protein [Deltaproteobacteria bacterium]